MIDEEIKVDTRFTHTRSRVIMKSMYFPGLKLEVRNIRSVDGGWLDKT